MPAGRELWVGLDLLDRQIVDVDDRPVAKVDDLEMTDSDEAATRPTISAVLCGPAVLGRRIGPRTGNFLEALRGLLREGPPQGAPISISFDLVTEIGSAIKLQARRRDLPVTAVDEFLGEHVIGHLPGAGSGGDVGEGAHDAGE
jgi:hypothetical protein